MEQPAVVIRTAIEKTLTARGVSVEVILEHPGDLAHGDYATNVALVAAKQLGENPKTLATSLVTELQDALPMVAQIAVAGPGFINFTLGPEFFCATLTTIHAKGDTWGTTDALADEDTMIEYTSPNLFKPLHIGNLVGNIIGESVARLYATTGATVRHINYPSDIGLTVAKGVWGITEINGDPANIDDLGRAYVAGNTAYEDGGAKDAIESINRALYAGSNAELSRIRDIGIATSLARLTELCKTLGTTFDAQIFESEAGPIGAAVVKDHPEVFVESDGATVYPGERSGLHTRVFLNSQGLPTYEAKDLGNFTLKRDRFPNWTRSIIVTGNEQTEYFKVLYAAIRDIFPDTREKILAHIPTGFLTLTTGKMSSRKGNVLTGESLIEELRTEALEKAKETRADDIPRLADMIAVAALKYQILRQRVGTNMIFDKAQALSFEGDSGPYLQYTHARAVSVLEKARDVGITPSTATPPTAPYTIERILYQYPEVVARAIADHSPHHVVTFLITLASAFNAFYAHERIADSTDPQAAYKTALTDAVRLTLQKGLGVLGIEAPQKM